jgi:hypothetical protein
LPAQFYDFYTSRNLTVSEAVILINGIKQAWATQNFRVYDIFFQNQLVENIFSVIAYGPNSQG